MKYKFCWKCRIKKPFCDFYKDKSSKLGIRSSCKECEKAYARKLRSKKKSILRNREYAKTYAKENKGKIRETKRIYTKKRRLENKNFQFSSNLRSRIYSALKGNYKSLSTMFLIGCDIDYLMYHIQEQFTEGMSWDNYGDWHVDHIKPCAKFDLSKPEEQHKCFNYTNLQPLWALDNILKGDKYDS